MKRKSKSFDEEEYELDNVYNDSDDRYSSMRDPVWGC